ncbi:MAG: pentapeptide repeat-containing protein [Xenococcus sp. MO_188.B8]|nr:pentapeptide repeat-containing protein [Xenococcus sp. MO_188.B8]
MSEEQTASNLQPTDTKMCPICGETINAAAKKCIHCEELIDQNWLGFKGKTLWDVLALLIVPIVLAVGGFLLNRAETERQNVIESAETERQNAKEEDRGRDKVLQSYFDKMTELLLKEELGKSNTKPEVQSIAQYKTLTALPYLDSRRKGLLLEFLYESKLIAGGSEFPLEQRSVCRDLRAGISEHEKPIVSLEDADLRGISLTNAILRSAALGGADLRDADLRGADLRCTDLRNADLRDADLRNADLRGADLRGAFLVNASLVSTDLNNALLVNAFLRGAALRGAYLLGADLRGFDLVNTDLRGAALWDADLRNADLRDADLGGADLRNADLEGADLRNADLTKAWANNDQLKTAILCETTMLDGKKENRDCPSDSSPSTPQTVPISSPAMVVGEYTVIGENPGGGAYNGTCFILYEDEVGRSFEIVWRIYTSRQKFEGIGEVTEKGELYIMYQGAFHGDGTWFLTPDGSIHGTWRAAGQVGEGTEIWTPVKAR